MGTRLGLVTALLTVATVPDRLGGDQGRFFITELACAPASGPKRIKLGLWHHTATFGDQSLDSRGPLAFSGADPRTHSGNTGANIVAEHTLAGKAGKPGHLDISARFGGAPSDRNALAWAFDAGLAWTGCIPGRRADIATLGFARATFRSRDAESTRLTHPSASRVNAEQVAELSYTVPLTDRFPLKPGLQDIRHPGGSSALPDAVLVKLRFNAGF